MIAEDGSPCSIGLNEVEENAELRAWLRPQTRTEKPFTRLYADPDFTPGVEPELRDPDEFPFVTLDSQPNSQTEYRMRIEEIDQKVEVQLSFLNSEDEWESIGGPLLVEPSQWKYVTGQNEDTRDYIYGFEESVTFEFINILLRRDINRQTGEPTEIGPTKIDAIALTQENISDSKSVPEPTSLFSLLWAGALVISTGWKSKKKI